MSDPKQMADDLNVWAMKLRQARRLAEDEDVWVHLPAGVDPEPIIPHLAKGVWLSYEYGPNG